MRHLPLLLVGCTFIAGPPDTSNVVSPLSDLSVSVDANGLVYDFVPSTSFTTGELRFELPEGPVSVQVPTDVPGWTPGSPYTLSVPRDWSCEGETLTLDLVVVRADGFELETFTNSTSMGGAGTQLGADLHVLCVQDVPFVFCGDLPNPADDFDQGRLEFATTERVRIDLTWEGDTDLDLSMLDDDLNILADDDAGGSVQPATIELPIQSTIPYRIQVTHFEGPDTLWKVTVTAAP